MVKRELVSVPEAALILGGISRTSLYRMFEAGKLRPVKIGSRTMLRVDDLREFVVRLQEQDEEEVSAA